MHMYPTEQPPERVTDEDPITRHYKHCTSVVKYNAYIKVLLRFQPPWEAGFPCHGKLGTTGGVRLLLELSLTGNAVGRRGKRQ